MQVEALVRISPKPSEQEKAHHPHLEEDPAVANLDKCWICLEGHKPSNPLLKLCSCMVVHRQCLSRWQLQNAGKRDEFFCRLCSERLPDWRDSFAHLPRSTPIMTIVHQGRSYQIPVEQGTDGRAKFEAEIRRIFQLSPLDQISLCFGCKLPGTQGDLSLQGFDAYDAAVYCASLSAGQRKSLLGDGEGDDGEGNGDGMGEERRQRWRKSSSSGSSHRTRGVGMLRRLFSSSLTHSDSR